MNATYDGRTIVYYFEGEEIDPPKPGTYDAANWTPPDRKRYKVSMYDTGCFSISENGAWLCNGDYSGRPSIKKATEILAKQLRT